LFGVYPVSRSEIRSPIAEFANRLKPLHRNFRTVPHASWTQARIADLSENSRDLVIPGVGSEAA
jgi:hypothetical protein